jgi:hypothetical protein
MQQGALTPAWPDRNARFLRFQRAWLGGKFCITVAWLDRWRTQPITPKSHAESLAGLEPGNQSGLNYKPIMLLSN